MRTVHSDFSRPLASWIDGAKEKRFLSSTSQQQAVRWLTKNGPRELEMLFRAIVFQSSAPILLADNDRQYREASVGASKLLGLPRERIIGRSLDDFAEPGLKPVISERWRRFLEEGEQEGTLQLVGPDGDLRDVEYSAKGNILPVRHLLVLRAKTKPCGAPAESDKAPAKSSVPAWVPDYALFLLDMDGQIVAWYAGAERIYGYKSGEIVGQHGSLISIDEDAPRKLKEELNRAAAAGHSGIEGWHVKKNGTRFWVNVITMVLKDENGDLQVLPGWRAISASVTRETKNYGGGARSSASSPLNRRLPASFPVSLTGFRRRTTHFSTWSDTAKRICRRDVCIGLISRHRNMWFWTISPTKRDCGSELARPSRRN